MSQIRALDLGALAAEVALPWDALSLLHRLHLVAPKPILTHLKDNTDRGRKGFGSRQWTLQTASHYRLNAWAYDDTSSFAGPIKPMTYQNAAASSQSGPATFSPYPIIL